MIIKDQTNSIETIGNVTEESQFKIKVSPKAFQILSSLYSDKPLAIVRELGCNGMDSHVASGQPNRPIHVHIPNTLEPWLTIQDFGTGISHQDIYKIYTEYFNSTKTNTNEQVGMLGLGSKSPFCYTDNFTITSIHGGVKRIYNAYFNQAGVPTISLASQEKTNDHNGVAIQIPVKQSDLSDFSTAVEKAFRFFDVKPDITGGEIKWLNKADFEGTFWKSFTNLNQSFAIMGGVAYPIDTYKVANEHYDIVRKAGLVIHFNIGELDVTPSREALMYHDWVLKAINDKIDLVKKDFVKIVENTITNSDNLLDAMKALYMLKDKWSFLNSSMINGKVHWKKVEITEPRKSIKNHAPLLRAFAKRQWGRSKYTESEYPYFHNGAEWFYDNLKKGSLKRTIQYVRSHGNSDIAVNLVTEYEMKDLIKAGFPASIFKPTSTLPAVSVVRASGGTKTSKPKGVITLYKIGYDYRSSWESVNFDLSTGTAPKYYIVKDGSSFNFNLGELVGGVKGFLVNVRVNDKQTLKQFCSYANISINDVRMVAKTNAQHLDALGSKNLQDVFDNNKNIDLDWEKIKRVRSIDLDTHKKIVKHKLFAQLDSTNILKVFVDSISDSIKEIQKLGDLSDNLPYIEKDNFPEVSLTSP